MESVELSGNSLLLRYEASSVNLVMASPRGPACEVVIQQDGQPIRTVSATTDTRFRENGESFIRVQEPRMYRLVDDPGFGSHELELVCPSGLAAFAFTFTSCVDPEHAAASNESLAL